jgi:hypothetical protein
MSLITVAFPERDRRKFTPRQQQDAQKIERAIKVQGFPQGFSSEGYDIAREPKSDGCVFIINNAKQVYMLNADNKLELYTRCKCGADGFLSALKHGPRCETTPSILRVLAEQWNPVLGLNLKARNDLLLNRVNEIYRTLILHPSEEAVEQELDYIESLLDLNSQTTSERKREVSRELLSLKINQQLVAA